MLRFRRAGAYRPPEWTSSWGGAAIREATASASRSRWSRSELRHRLTLYRLRIRYRVKTALRLEP